MTSGRLETFFAKIVPSNLEEGEIGSVRFNIWLAQATGVPLVGLKPETFRLHSALIMYGIFMITTVTFSYSGFELYDLALNWQDLDSMTQNSCLSLTHVSGAIKVVNILYRLPELRQVLNKLKYVTKTFVRSDKQMEVFSDGEMENTLVLSIYITIVGFTGFLGMVMLYMNPEESAGKTFPYRAILPTWMPKQLQLLYMGLSLILFAIQIISVDYLNMTLINQIRFQLNILNLSFDELTVDIQPNSKSTQSLVTYKEDPVKRLNDIIEHHCLLIELRQETEDIFSKAVLLQFFTSVVIFAMTGFQATVMTEGSDSAVIIYFYCGCIFCELFVYCWFGNEVFEQSKTLATSGFNSSWYLFDRRYGKSLLVFLANAQRPFIFTAGGFMTLSLPSFAGILSKSYSYIALLRQIYKETT